jgi:HPt (histidine-containing phosphotransfer) domain-containing protein
MEDKMIFDRDALLQRLSGDLDQFRDLLAHFLEDIPRQISALREALGAADLKLALRVSHTIKGAALNYSALSLGKAAGAVNAKLEAGDIDQARILAFDIGMEFDRFQVLAQKEWRSDGASH